MPRKTKQDIINELRTELSEQKERSEYDCVLLEKQIKELKQKHGKEIEQARQDELKNAVMSFVNKLDSRSMDTVIWDEDAKAEVVTTRVHDDIKIVLKNISIDVLREFAFPVQVEPETVFGFARR